MIKRLVVLAMVALVALVAVTPALAAGNGQGHVGPGSRDQQFFSVLGTIEEIVGNEITVEVVDGSWAVWAAGYVVGDELPVNVTLSTAFYRWTPDGRLPIAFADVIVGDMTNIHGTVDVDGDFTADRVTVDVVCP